MSSPKTLNLGDSTSGGLEVPGSSCSPFPDLFPYSGVPATSAHLPNKSILKEAATRSKDAGRLDVSFRPMSVATYRSTGTSYRDLYIVQWLVFAVEPATAAQVDAETMRSACQHVKAVGSDN